MSKAARPGPVDEAGGQVNAADLAARTGATVAQIEELVAAGIVTPTADGP